MAPPPRVGANHLPPWSSGFAEAARDLGVTTGKIYAVRAAYGLTLEFSGDIPAHAHQRFRNLLGLHRHRIKGG